jgi:glycosyltransferase involved in cell wall biosynthesis
MEHDKTFTKWQSLEQGQEHVLVSIVVITYQRDARLLSLLYALRAQTHERIEVIVAHDGPDGGLLKDVIEPKLNDTRFRFYTHHENTGHWGYKIRSHYEQYSTGDFVGGMADDDWCAPTYVEWLLHDALAQRADFAYCDFVHNHSRWGAHNAIPVEGGIGIGGWIARSHLVKGTPHDGDGFTEDGRRVARIMQKSQGRAHVPAYLFVHG